MIRGRPTEFTVDCSKAGRGDVSIGIKSKDGKTDAEDDVKFDISKDDSNDTFTVKYNPDVAGRLL